MDGGHRIAVEIFKQEVQVSRRPIVVVAVVVGTALVLIAGATLGIGPKIEPQLDLPPALEKDWETYKHDVIEKYRQDVGPSVAGILLNAFVPNVLCMHTR